MSDWNAGYITHLEYTYGYYIEQNPLRLQLAFLKAGLVPPSFGTACELGFGQGMSVNINAAASRTRWYGNDFNPAHAAFAQELAQVSGAGAQLSDESFERFCQRSDLPDFDYICLHGIWSWVSTENQATILEFISRKLKPGGALYISYNALPGCAPMLPLRDLLAEHSRVMSAPGLNTLTRIEGALDFAGRLAALEPLFLKANPLMGKRLDDFSTMDRTYMAHEYFNSTWQPMSFSTIAPLLKQAKLEFASPALYSDLVDEINLSAEQHQFLTEIPDSTFRETARDMLVNRQFRQDFWVKGARRLNAFERHAALGRLRFMLVTPRKQITMTMPGARGNAELGEGVFGPVLDLLEDHAIYSISELEQSLQGSPVDFQALLQALTILVGKSCLSAVQDDDTIAAARPQTDRLNRHLLEQALSSQHFVNLASPVTGSGVMVQHLQQLFMLARQRGEQTPEQWAAFAWPALQAMQINMVRDGVTLLTEAENLAQIREHARHFNDLGMPIMRALGLVV